jgi:hypothetical protein
LTFYDRGMSDSEVAERARPELDRVISIGLKVVGLASSGRTEPATAVDPHTAFRGIRRRHYRVGREAMRAHPN